MMYGGGNSGSSRCRRVRAAAGQTAVRVRVDEMARDGSLCPAGSASSVHAHGSADLMLTRLSIKHPELSLPSACDTSDILWFGWNSLQFP
jgi:hypothetical protein